MPDLDPYHRWLGIPPDEQPAGPHRLLGVSPDENDPQVVREAALRQTAFVRQFSLGEHGEYAERILGELAEARDSILSGKVESPTKPAVKPTPSPVETIAAPLVNVTAKSATVATKATASWYRTQWATFSITAAAMLILFASWPSAEMSESRQDDSLVKENEELGIQIQELTHQNADLKEKLVELAIGSKARTIGKTASPLIPAEAVSFQGHRYHLIENKVPWHQAEMDAAAMGGYLIRLESTAEHDFVISWLKELNCGSHVHIDGTRFLDGETFLFSDNREMPLDLLHKGNIKGLPQKNWEQFLFLAAGNFHINSWHFHQSFYIVEWSVDQIPNSLNPIIDISGSLEEGLVAYYPFNGNANDESGNGNHGEVNGAIPSTDRHNQADRSYLFDGANDRIVLSNQTLDFYGTEQTSTISLWISPEVDNGVAISKGFETVFHAENNGILRGNRYCKLSFYQEGAQYFLYKSNLATATDCRASKGLALDTWNHVVVIRKRIPAFYLNGDNVTKLNTGLKNTWTANYDDRLTGSTITIGAEQWLNRDNQIYWKNSLKGKLDEVRIYNRALSAAEVKALYEFEKP